MSRRFEIPREIRSIEDAYYYHTRNGRTTEFNLILAPLPSSSHTHSHSPHSLPLSPSLCVFLLFFTLSFSRNVFLLLYDTIFPVRLVRCIRTNIFMFLFLTGSYLILSILFGHRLLLRLPLALVSVILKPYFHL